jgi:hypothetical protein
MLHVQRVVAQSRRLRCLRYIKPILNSVFLTYLNTTYVSFIHIPTCGPTIAPPALPQVCITCIGVASVFMQYYCVLLCIIVSISVIHVTCPTCGQQSRLRCIRYGIKPY